LRNNLNLKGTHNLICSQKKKANQAVAKQSKAKSKTTAPDEVESVWTEEQPEGWGDFNDRIYTGNPEGPSGASAGVLTALDCFRKMMTNEIINVVVQEQTGL
jgi:hypothetical protein